MVVFFTTSGYHVLGNEQAFRFRTTGYRDYFVHQASEKTGV